MPGPSNSPRKRNTSRKPNGPRKQAVWFNLTPAEASGQRDGNLSARRVASEIYTDKLTLTPSQKEQVSLLYAQNSIVDHQFSTRSDIDQSQAAVVLGVHDLHIGSAEDITSRWGMRWSDSGKEGRVGKGRNAECNSTRRVLYQCQCGYDEKVAGSKKRNAPLPFTGCMAHAEITYEVKSQKILRVRGYFEHNDACKNASYSRFPPIPLHSDVFTEALQQLRAGCSLTDIQERNRTLLHARAYPALSADPEIDERYRWLLRSYDTRSLYRQFNRLQGIKVTEPAHLNIHEWLDPTSSQYNQTLRDAIFYYQARQDKGDRFKACVATPEMRDATWKYAHKSQIILDGTFGICDRKVLLFILMGVDEDKKGVPLAFLFFSAPSSNRHTASGYNTEILAELLGQWKKELGERNGEAFNVLVAITDTDLKERGALLIVFPGIWLLICKFHLRQSWQNQRNKALRGNSPLHMLLKRRVALLEDSLVSTNTLLEAQELIQKELRVVTGMKTQDPASATLYDTAITHIQDYLLGYWTTNALWSSWSDFGRNVAASKLNCPFDGVLPTTNHLESFNGVLKRKHLRRWQKGGRRLRLDVLLMLLITKILPAIFCQRKMEREDREWWDSVARRRFQGGEKLVQARKTGTKQKSLKSPSSPLAYLVPDPERDTAAHRLLQHHQLSTPEISSKGTSLTFTCYSSLSVAHEEQATQYQICLRFDGMASCTCPDWTSRGGACKHLRAALIRSDEIRQQWPSLPLVPLPDSLMAAQVLQAQLEQAQVAADTAIQHQPSHHLMQAAAIGVQDMLENASDDVYLPSEHSQHVQNARTPIPDQLDDSDTESVASDASAPPASIDFDVQRFDVAAGAQNAFNSQAVSRTFHDFELALPKLVEWTEYLQYADHLPSPDDHARAKRYNEQILALSKQLERLILAGNRGTTSESGAPTILSGQETSQQGKDGEETKMTVEGKPLTQKRHHAANIIAPSPEKSQKRQKSYGSH
ncbi:hypothetical protein VNI00_018232 [Paramarasmius palmivorus]|uniref:SWIM-type domain-containing protein n=1 Tax=Paramarasmius palmivorus TaxID=297713 RepID=A0AAW0AYP1_9AGAR